MKSMNLTITAVAGLLSISASCALAQDWPQWRGPNRDGKASTFTAPKTWPKELTQKWKVTVGLGDATPALVGNKLYIFARQDADEVIRCLDAAKGKMLWHKDDFSGAWPKFYPSSSPLVTGGLCIAQLGGESNGGIVAYDLATGNEKWKWTGDGTAYASPVLLTVGGTKMVVTLTPKKIVGIGVTDGKLLWEAPMPTIF